MKITDGKNIIKAGLPRLKQALFYAYNDPACQAVDELHITPELGPKVEGKSGAGTGAADKAAKSGTGENSGSTANSGTGGKE
jgi:L-aminopeptidase/D-esterase-like protein